MESDKNLKEEAKKNSIRDGSAHSVMDGMGIRYITPYALSIGISNRIIGILNVLPALFGNLLRISFNKIYYKSSRKKLILPFVFMQAFFWIPLLLVGLFYFFLGLKLLCASILLVLFYSIIIISGVIVAPAWTSWMQDLVEENRGVYFSKRNRITGFVLMISMLTAGLILDFFETKQVFFGFAVLFLLASAGRYLSFYFLKKQYEPKISYDKSTYFSFFDFIKKMPSNNFGKFVIFVSLLSFSVAVASPFFSVYMLKDLKLSYLAFTIISLSSLISPILFLRILGKFSDKVGTVKVMRISGFFITFTPALWILSFLFIKTNTLILIFYLFAVEFFSGIVWAAFNLSSSNFIYDAVTKQKIILCFTYFSFINSIGAFFGGFLGGQISGIPSFSLFGLSTLLSVFLISFLLRLIPVLFIAPLLKEVRKVDFQKNLSLNFLKNFRIKERFHSFWKFISSPSLRPK